MNVLTILECMLAGIMAVSLVTGCGTATTDAASATPRPESESGWQRFQDLLLTSRMEDADGRPTAKALLVRRQLGIDKCGMFAFSGFLGIAQGPRNAVGVFPMPEPGCGEEAMLACTGDICGDDAPEFALSVGWGGPTSGYLFLYDHQLKLLDSFEPLGSISGLQLLDLTGDGKAEIILWADNHPGTGMFYTTVHLLRATARGKLQRLFMEPTYSFSWSGMAGDREELIRQRISFIPARNRPESQPAIEVCTEPRTGKPPRVFFWDRKRERFEERRQP